MPGAIHSEARATGAKTAGAASATAGVSSLGRRRLGIVSGAGPDAGVDLLQKILRSNREAMGTGPSGGYKTDRDAPAVVLFQVPGMGGPRGERDLVEEEGEPFKLVWRSLTQTIEEMAAIGVERFCISCNTLHVLESRVREYMAKRGLGEKMEFVSIVQAVEQYLQCKAETDGKVPRVAVLGTLPTTDVSGPAGKSSPSPYGALPGLVRLPDGDRQALQTLINAVKATTADGQDKGEKLKEIVWTARENVDVFLLACTELPLVVAQSPGWYFNPRDGPLPLLLDPTQLLANELVREDLAQLRRPASSRL